MSDVSPEQYAEFATQDGPGSADVDGADTDPPQTEQRHPAPEEPTKEKDSDLGAPPEGV
ncbi:hypothetical protein [Actinoplanes sp. NPDC051859]|uniref:hypothetical protein n=1 Tax=Actinoplanes sp. NPDC051859 TaxID=3363909 RepID=UPI00379BF4BA